MILQLLLSIRSDSLGNNTESNVEVLIMKEYSVENSWNLLFVVQMVFCRVIMVHWCMPLGYTKNVKF